MNTCANCSATAVYVYDVAPSFALYYCAKHLPGFLKRQAASGELNIPVIVPAPKSTKKKTAPVVEEPGLEEEPVVEDGTN